MADTDKTGETGTAAEAAPGAKAIPDPGAPPRRMCEIAAEAIDRLGVRDFIGKHLGDITERLKECESAAQNAPVDSDMLFIALSLPILNGVIHIASNRENLQRAIAWATHKWRGHPGAAPRKRKKDFDPISILSSLTLIFVVCEGSKARSAGEKKKDKGNDQLWKDIVKHIRDLGKEIE
jgi:hypothetical protein